MWWINQIRDGRVFAAAPTEVATKDYNEEMKAAMPQTVWVTGCTSWYLGKDGLPELFPWQPVRHRELLADAGRRRLRRPHRLKVTAVTSERCVRPTQARIGTAGSVVRHSQLTCASQAGCHGRNNDVRTHRIRRSRARCSSPCSACPIRRRGTGAGATPTADHWYRTGSADRCGCRCGTNGGCHSQHPEPTVLLLSTSDTDLITARASGAGYRWANPSRLVDGELTELLDGADIVVVRILGGYRAWQDGIDAVVASGVPTVVVSGEQAPDAELMEPLHDARRASRCRRTSTWPRAAWTNLRQLHAFLCDTLLMTGFGFAPPVTTPTWGVLERAATRQTTARRSRCSTTAPSTWPATPPTSRRCAGPSKTQAAGRCRCTARRCAPPTPGCSNCSAPPTRW